MYVRQSSLSLDLASRPRSYSKVDSALLPQAEGTRRGHSRQRRAGEISGE